MARNIKQGLDYFPFDVDFFQDLRIRKLVKYQGGGKPVAVYALLLCIIYKDGYYTRWDEELPFIISEQTGYDEAYIREVIRCCLNIGLFSKELYDSEGVLTSKGIQLRYRNICRLSKRLCRIHEFSLIPSEEKGIPSEEMAVNSEEMAINSEKSTQRKEKKRKINKTSSFSSSSSPTAKEEADAVTGTEVQEEEKQDFLEMFFFKNFSDPWKQAERFIALNTSRGWKDSWGIAFDTPRKRLALAELWERKGADGNAKRFPQWFLKSWQQAYAIARRDPEIGDMDVTWEMLDDRVKATGNGENRIIYCGPLFERWCMENRGDIIPLFQGVKWKIWRTDNNVKQQKHDGTQNHGNAIKTQVRQD